MGKLSANKTAISVVKPTMAAVSYLDRLLQPPPIKVETSPGNYEGVETRHYYLGAMMIATSYISLDGRHEHFLWTTSGRQRRAFKSVPALEAALFETMEART